MTNSEIKFFCKNYDSGSKFPIFKSLMFKQHVKHSSVLGLSLVANTFDSISLCIEAIKGREAGEKEDLDLCNDHKF